MIGLAAGVAVPGGLVSLYGQRGRGGAGPALAGDTGSTLVLLGTQGGPNVTLGRSQSASAVIAGGQPYLVDCGYGTLRALVEAGIPFNRIGDVFLTHLHDDHTADLAALLTHKWTNGSTNPQPARVWGPYGSQAMVEGAIAFFRANVEIRMVDEGRTVRPESIFSGHDLAAPGVTEVFRDDQVTVQAVENAHFPERAREQMPYRSFAYRFNAADRSFVFSGDTAYSTSLVEMARGADVFVCETMTMAMRRQFEGRGGVATDRESIGRHVLETHVGTEDAARMASEAGVGTLVLNHLLPGATGRGAADEAYLSGIREIFDGEIIVGQDQMRI
jgi:ribonuclease BN (tRNA processing enzyme)